MMFCFGAVVSRIVRQQAHFYLGRPPGGNEAEEAGDQGGEAGRADDGLWDSDGFGI
jgi:hypothetical protein